jgi:hypothetical protein
MARIAGGEYGPKLGDNRMDPRQKKAKRQPRSELERTSFSTNRSLDYFSRKELIAQVGHSIYLWPVVILKELVDNSIDACEEACRSPDVNIAVTSDGIRIEDNGPGISPEAVDGICDFDVRQSSREAYVAPDRGAQGNALKTLMAMPFVVTGEPGRVVISSRGVRHEITVEADNVRQEPVITHDRSEVANDSGMKVFVGWPSQPDGESDEWIQDDDPASTDLARSIAAESKVQFLQIADDFGILNPHLTLSVQWHDEPIQVVKATDTAWRKWRPNQPTSSHWYQDEHLGRLIAAYLSHDEGNDRERTVREFLSEFDGLTGSAKQKKVLDSTGMARDPLSVLANGRGLQMDTRASHSRPLQRRGLTGEAFCASLEPRLVPTEIGRQSGGSPHQVLGLHVGLHLPELLVGELGEQSGVGRNRLEAVLVGQPDRFAAVGLHTDHPAREIHGELAPRRIRCSGDFRRANPGQTHGSGRLQ